MAKPEPNTSLDILQQHGFDAALPPHEAVEKLKQLRSEGSISTPVIAQALSHIADAEAAQMLAELEQDLSGQDRREVRRALFKLRQKGIETPPAQAQEKQARPSAAADPGLSALISPTDPEGARIAWLVKERRQGGINRLWGLTSEVEGLVGATLTPLSRRELRTERSDLERRAGAKLVDADPALADFLLCEAYRNTPEARRGQVGNFYALRAEIIAAPAPAEFEHPVYRELNAEAADEPSVELLKEPEVAAWRLNPDQIRPYVNEVAEIQQSPLVLNRFQQEDRINLIIDRAAGELLSGPNADRIRRRFEDLAYYFARSGKKDQAKWAVAAAAKIRSGDDLKRHPFFQHFIRVNLGAVIAAEQEEKREEPRLIMTPAEAMRARQRQPGRRG
jgi:hypothetical protein